MGANYEYTITATGTPEPEYTVVAGALPPGLTLDSATGVISGEPTEAGTYAVTINVGNGELPDASASYVITIAAAAVPAPEVVPPGGTPEVVPPGGTPEVAPPVGTPQVAPPIGTGEFVSPVGAEESGTGDKLAESGIEVGAAPVLAVGVMILGTVLVLMTRARRHPTNSASVV